MQKTRWPGIYRLQDGRLFVRATVRVDGRKINRKRTLDPGATVRDAQRALNELREEAVRNRSTEKPTVASYVLRWLRAKAERNSDSRNYALQCTLKNHIVPVLGHLRVDQVTRADVDGWVRYCERLRLKNGDPFAHATTLGWWTVLCQILKDAVADGLLQTDPTLRVRPPRRQVEPKRERRTLTAEELARFLAAVRRHAPSPQRYVEGLVLASTGMRAGELYALHWEDIRDGTITIRRSHWKGKVKRTKTWDPRVVPIPDVVQEELRQHRRWMIQNQVPGVDSGIVFPGPDGGYRPTSSFWHMLRKLPDIGVDIRVGPQVLRRTFNTLLIGASVDRIVLRSIMGHCSEQMTERYAGVGEEMKRAAIARISQVVSRGGVPTAESGPET